MSDTTTTDTTTTDTTTTAAAWAPNTFHCEGLVITDANVDALDAGTGTMVAVDPNDTCIPKSSWFDKYKDSATKTAAEEDAYYKALTAAQVTWIQSGDAIYTSSTDEDAAITACAEVQKTWKSAADDAVAAPLCCQFRYVVTPADATANTPEKKEIKAVTWSTKASVVAQATVSTKHQWHAIVLDKDGKKDATLSAPAKAEEAKAAETKEEAAADSAKTLLGSMVALGAASLALMN